MNSEDKKKIKEYKRELRKIEDEYRLRKVEAGKNGSSARDIHEIEIEERDQIEEYVDVIVSLQTKDLKEQALKYAISLPDGGKMWRETMVDRDKVLSTEGQLYLKRLIKAEKREIMKLRLQYISTIGSIVIGIIGSIIGLLSVLN